MVTLVRAVLMTTLLTMLDFFIGRVAVAQRSYGQRKSVGMYLIFLAVTTALCFAYGELAAETTGRSASDAVAQEAAAPDEGSTIERQNIQRLLKLLADRYPNKYGSVDPGTIDGSFGTETKTAIRNFRQISGSRSGASDGGKLVADILAALAQMSATQPADAPRPQPPASAPGAAPAAATIALPSDPRAGTADIKTPEAKATPTGKADTAAAADSPRIATPKPSRAQPASKNQRFYFVQAASLKSLESAKREWRRIFESNRAALTGEQVYYEKANLGDRGVFFRILIGPMNEKDAAGTLCAFLKQNDQTCVVTAKDPTGLLKGESFTDATTKPAPAGEGTRAPRPPVIGNGEALAARSSQNSASAPAEEAVVDGKTEAAPPRQENAAGPPASGEITGATDGGMTGHDALAVKPAAPAAGPPAPAAAKAGTPEAAAGGGSATSSSAEAGAEQAAAPDQRNAETITPAEAAPAAAGRGPPPANDVRDTAPQSRAEPQSGDGDNSATQGAEIASDGIPPASRLSAALDAARALLSRLAENLDQVVGAAAVMIIGTGALIYGWRRRNRRSELSQIFQSANLVLPHGESENEGTLGTIENDFESESLRQSRHVRDKFLRETLGGASDENAARADDAAMRINSSLKALLVEEPSQYKSIFLNWIFLAKVGAALNNREIAVEQLSDRVNREFDLLQTYFKIHLLELDDRHRIRQELPGLFYCLQVSQMQKRQNSAEYSAA